MQCIAIFESSAVLDEEVEYGGTRVCSCDIQNGGANFTDCVNVRAVGEEPACEVFVGDSVSSQAGEFCESSFSVHAMLATGRKGDEAYFNMTLPISVLLLISQP